MAGTAALNRGHMQPDGRQLRHEDLIQPGWTLLLPSDAQGLPDAPREQDPSAAPAPVQEQPPRAPLPMAPPLPEAPPSPESPAPAATPTAAPTGGSQSAAPRGADERSAADMDGDLVGLPAALAGGGLLAAGLLLALARLRRTQQRHRRTGRHIRRPSPALARAEVALHVLAEPDDLDFLDRGLRTLGLALAEYGGPLPAVVGARLTEDALELLLAAAAPNAPTPFLASQAAQVWVLPRDAELPDEDTMAGLLCPLPALVPLGRDDRGLVLLDIEAAGVTSLVGAPVDVAPVMAWIVAELAVSTWSDYLQVTLVGFGDQLTGLDPERVEVVAALDWARQQAIAARISALSGGAGYPADDVVLRSRITRGMTEAWMPEIFVFPGPPDDEATRTVLKELSQANRQAVAVVVAGDCPEARVRLRVVPDGTIEVSTLGLTIRANRLDNAHHLAPCVAARVRSRPP